MIFFNVWEPCSGITFYESTLLATTYEELLMRKRTVL